MAKAPQSAPDTAVAGTGTSPIPALPSAKVPHANERHDASLTLIDRVALRITGLVGTMACAGIFAVIALVSLPSALRTGSVIIIVAWVAQTFLQLVLLPLLMVGQNLQGRHAETRAQADYEVNCKAFADAEAMLAKLAGLEAQNLALAQRIDTLLEAKP